MHQSKIHQAVESLINYNHCDYVDKLISLIFVWLNTDNFIGDDNIYVGWCHLQFAEIITNLNAYHLFLQLSFPSPRFWVKNEDVAGASPVGEEWSTILLPDIVCLILGIWR